MINVHCLNNISESGLSMFSEQYNKEASYEEALSLIHI